MKYNCVNLIFTLSTNCWLHTNWLGGSTILRWQGNLHCGCKQGWKVIFFYVCKKVKNIRIKNFMFKKYALLQTGYSLPWLIQVVYGDPYGRPVLSNPTGSDVNSPNPFRFCHIDNQHPEKPALITRDVNGMSQIYSH